MSVNEMAWLWISNKIIDIYRYRLISKYLISKYSILVVEPNGKFYYILAIAHFVPSILKMRFWGCKTQFQLRHTISYF